LSYRQVEREAVVYDRAERDKQNSRKALVNLGKLDMNGLPEPVSPIVSHRRIDVLKRIGNTDHANIFNSANYS
jgi:hypothetical protein